MNHFNQKSGDYYDYSTKPTNSLHRAKQERLLTTLNWGNWESHESVLSVGCGHAPLLNIISSLYPNITLTGVDISSEMVVIANSEVPNGRFCQTSAESLPFSDEKFDAVVSLGIMPYVANPRKVISEMSRVLSDGGQLIFNWSNNGLAKKIRRVYQSIRRIGKLLTGWGTPSPYQLRTQSPSDMRNWLYSEGLSIESVRYINCAPGLSRTWVERDIGKMVEQLSPPTITSYLASIGMVSAWKSK